MQLSQDFIDDMRELLGEAESGQLIASLDEWTPVSVRFNTSKLSQLPSVGTPVPWDGSAVYLPAGLHSPLTRCFMRAVIMCKKLVPCS